MLVRVADRVRSGYVEPCDCAGLRAVVLSLRIFILSRVWLSRPVCLHMASDESEGRSGVSPCLAHGGVVKRWVVHLWMDGGHRL
eukprot:3578850-Alexandrium_andersonii.AAC.1